MTKMEIATYLGMLNSLLSITYKEEQEELTGKMLQAVQEAQLMMYELTRAEFIKERNDD